MWAEMDVQRKSFLASSWGKGWITWFGAFYQSLLYKVEKTRVKGHQLAHSRRPPYLVRKWLSSLPHHILPEVPLEKWPGILWEPGKVLSSISLRSSYHHWFGSPRSPLGLRAVPLPVAFSVSYQAESQWTFPIQAAFVFPVILLATVKTTDIFSVRQWLWSRLPGSCPHHGFPQGWVTLRWYRG